MESKENIERVSVWLLDRDQRVVLQAFIRQE